MPPRKRPAKQSTAVLEPVEDLDDLDAPDTDPDLELELSEPDPPPSRAGNRRKSKSAPVVKEEPPPVEDDLDDAIETTETDELFDEESETETNRIEYMLDLLRKEMGVLLDPAGLDLCLDVANWYKAASRAVDITDETPDSDDDLGLDETDEEEELDDEGDDLDDL